MSSRDLLIILEFPGSSKVGELVNDGPVVTDELHDVAGLQVSGRMEKGWLTRNRVMRRG
jgi:hypothetical protein